MTEDTPIESDVAGETQEEKTQRLNFFSDGVRAGLFSAATDIQEQMAAAGVPDGASCMLTGACQFVAELYEGMAAELGIDRQKMREHLLNSTRVYFDTFCQMRISDTASGESAVQ